MLINLAQTLPIAPTDPVSVGDWVMKLGVPGLLAVMVYFLVRYILAMQTKHDQIIKERDDRCSTCREKHTQDLAKLNDAIQTKTENLLREQLAQGERIIEALDTLNGLKSGKLDITDSGKFRAIDPKNRPST